MGLTLAPSSLTEWGSQACLYLCFSVCIGDDNACFRGGVCVRVVEGVEIQ